MRTKFDTIEDCFDNEIAIRNNNRELNLKSYTLQTTMDGVIELNFVLKIMQGMEMRKNGMLLRIQV